MGLATITMACRFAALLLAATLSGVLGDEAVDYCAFLEDNCRTETGRVLNTLASRISQDCIGLGLVESVSETDTGGHEIEFQCPAGDEAVKNNCLNCVKSSKAVYKKGTELQTCQIVEGNINNRRC